MPYVAIVLKMNDFAISLVIEVNAVKTIVISFIKLSSASIFLIIENSNCIWDYSQGCKVEDSALLLQMCRQHHQHDRQSNCP